MYKNNTNIRYYLIKTFVCFYKNITKFKEKLKRNLKKTVVKLG